MTFSMTEVSDDLADFTAGLPELRSSIDQQLANIDLGSVGIGFSDSSNARVIGIYGGTAPGLTWGGAEVQVLYAYDQQTGETGLYYYVGGTIGPSVGANGQRGIFLFDGPIDQLTGFSYGIQGAAGVAVGYARSPSGYNMVQIGAELGLSAEITFGWTFDINGVAQVDWDVTARTLQRLYSDSPEVLAGIMSELAIARSLGGGWKDDFVEKYGDLIVYGYSDSCFLPGTMIEMWPLDPLSSFEADCIYNDISVSERVWRKPIEDIRPGDLVVSFDREGNQRPGRVTRTFKNSAKIVLDFFGTGVTPGHVYYRVDSKSAHKFETLIDILRDDGVVQASDGTKIRAATGVPLDDPRDSFIWAITGAMAPDGRGIVVQEKGRIRLGTRFITEDGRDLCVFDLIDAQGGQATEEGLIDVAGVHLPFHWVFGSSLPKPESYVLQRSGTTLTDIYQVSEWESQRPQMPTPTTPSGEPIRPAAKTELSLTPRNTPIAMRDGAMRSAPHTENDPIHGKRNLGVGSGIKNRRPKSLH